MNVGEVREFWEFVEISGITSTVCKSRISTARGGGRYVHVGRGSSDECRGGHRHGGGHGHGV